MSGVRCLLMVTALLLTACSGSSQDNQILHPGIGYANFVLGKTKKSNVVTQEHSEEYFAKKGLWFSFNANDLLDTIVTTSPEFRSDKGVRPGDSEEQVEKLYGKGVASQYELRKGELPIGAIGEKTITYPGIHFVIAKHKVWAIVIVPRS